ncbi:phosphate ABC transporter permease PstA [bacterium]|nr:phosphate ABC transporter permease PstA [bacterium]
MRYQRVIFTLLAIITFLTVLPLLFIFALLIYHSIPVLSFKFIFGYPKEGMTAGGIFPALVGTLYLALGTAFISLPLGIITAIYLNEYAPKGKISRLVRIAIVNLAGVPSVVYGLFGLAVFVMLFHFGVSLLAGIFTLSILVLPIVITAAEEGLRAVPMSFREASLALGATKWQTIWKIILPNALPGIATGAILSISRAAGETAPILFTCAAFYLPRLPKSPFDEVMALPYHVYVISTQVPDAPLSIQYGATLVLLTLVFSLNLIAIIWRMRIRRAKKW